MNTLTVRRGPERITLSFTAPEALSSVLERGGVAAARTCGGLGKCGKCAVELTGCVSDPNEQERRLGARLACQAVLLGDAAVRLPEAAPLEQIQLAGGEPAEARDPMPGELGAAVDIGTTTLAARVYDLTDGRRVGELGAENPQRAFAADVMGRISSALAGDAPALREKVTDGIGALLGRILAGAGRAGQRIDALVVTGNTTMLHLLTGQDTTALSRAPFQAERLFDEQLPLFGGRCYLPPCISAFVGADITCAVLASGMCKADEPALLCDIGTNGEIALWKDGTLYVTSTAAGPAFEGAGLSCGCGSVRGAIDRVWAEDGAVRVHTIGGGEPVGLCGSGLLDALAAYLELGAIDETGAIGGEYLTLAPAVRLTRADIRAAQLAKGAVAAGIEMLLRTARTELDQISALYIAGGFGGHMDMRSAVRIGLIPAELGPKARFLGNAALAGAERLLLDRACLPEIRRIAAAARPVDLGGDPAFNESFIDHLYFSDCFFGAEGED